MIGQKTQPLHAAKPQEAAEQQVAEREAAQAAERQAAEREAAQAANGAEQGSGAALAIDAGQSATDTAQIVHGAEQAKAEQAGNAAQIVHGAEQTAKCDVGSGHSAQAAQQAHEQELPADRRRGKVYFTASRIAKLALLTALAYVVTFLEFPIFPAAPFLQLDFSNVFLLLGGFLYGPLAAIVISLLKECLSLLDTSTGGVGEIANFLINFAFYIVPTIVYRYKKGLKWVIPMLAIGVILQIGAGLLVNRYINFPLYMGAGAQASFEALWWYIILFNLIKGVAVSAVTVLLYKRISWLFRKF